MRARRSLLWTASFCLIGSIVFSGGRDLAALGRQLDLWFEDPSFARAFWGVQIQSLRSGEVLYQKNPDKLLMPASNLKLLTATAAIERLGLDFRYPTIVAARGRIAGGSLRGDLVVIGSGDPTLGARVSSPDLEDIGLGDPLKIFRDWANELKSQGIWRIEGDLLGDDSVFDDVRLGKGWSWDDLPLAFAAEISGLQYNENSALVRVTPAGSTGLPPALELVPATGYLRVDNRVLTVEAETAASLRFEREPPDRLLITGVVPVGSAPVERRIAVSNPTVYFLTVLREVLQAEGIAVAGRARRQVLEDEERQTLLPLLRYESPDLRFVLTVLLKISQNLYAESLLKTLDSRRRGKSFSGGIEQVGSVLTGMGIPTDAYVLADGSGLSRFNLLTAGALVRLLQFVYRRAYRDEVLNFLPLAGVDGTLRNRMTATPAEGNVRAKTGTLAHVRTLSGYVTTQDGDVFCFSMLANHFDQPFRSAEYLQDSALTYLASLGGPAFSRAAASR